VTVGLRIAAAVALSALLSVNAPVLAAPSANTAKASSLAERIRQKQIEVEAARKRLAEKRGQLRVRQLRSQDLQNQLAETNSSISRVAASLDALGGEIHYTQRKLDWNQRQLDAAEATLKRHNDALNRRLVDAYERGDMGYVNVLLSANSFSDFVERWDDIRYLIAANERTVRARRDAERTVASVQRELERQRLLLADTVKREQQDKYQLAALADQKTQLVAVAEQNRRSTAREVAQLEELTASQEASLEELIREKQRQEEARRAAERRAAKLAGHELPPEIHVGAPRTFSWPATGPITSPFGMRADPFGHGFRKHSGIDIGAPMSSTITAAAAGRVIMAHWYGGYGNAIIIDHGGKTVTLYGHCSQIFVSEGQDVQRGQAIGAVGSTGNSTGPHLHFEVRINGVPVDPIGRLK
jgi:murein DD-endopeptidase MepM/ murein hydrolase activator NlpD